MLVPGLIQRQSQSLVMTPQLRQAIALLQYTQTDLAQHLHQICETNPLLILEPGDTAPEAAPASEDFHDDDPDRFTTATARPEAAAPRPSDRDELILQIRLSIPPDDQNAAFHLLDSLDEIGRLSVSVTDLAAELGMDASHIEAIRQTLMHLEPVGLFARSLEECLAAQLRVRNRLDPAMQILLDNLDLLARRDWRKLRQKCALEQDDLLYMLAEIQALDPRPGLSLPPAAPPIEPDLIVRSNGTGFRLSLNTRLLPKLRLDDTMRAQLDSHTEAGKTLLAYATEATALIRALDSRKQSLLTVGRAIVQHQAAFLRDGPTSLRPLTMREIAECTELHESTISRIVSSKYIDTPQGTVPLKMFFSTALTSEDGTMQSAHAIQHRLQALVAAEGDNVLSDDALTALLQKEGFSIQRRTVAKYREGLGIAKSSQRKRLRRTS
ncbi:RNA polymerase factor sigma-54 [Gluconobacter roseus]|uniref:RNA polymerase sigma-54 factor n=1 Tax=Gluconobacter roseus NBRC 3990 TaxID=1307950 RepID=A0A4Y3M9G8_9PROT|nr:RNA polymerase factor sigma-54 [Gluconobacter roseus]KXV44188.1 RNA polymerase subunit sigma-54 [Gluconobacter roseus]GBR45435.1 RNA polymerase sigma-54 factor RpoN [Gluconobacter roseus NBRC 3990]GEB02969.1 RNA polymerase sigma-54 factor [Gluconobacter roseus NBRC 3990]GLP93427.1 RNA polymerase sigma-54 factor [Gluconobacter roseus NBRC 3990]